MTKEEYLESKRGKSITEVLAEVPTTVTRGSIDSRFVQEMTTILASGLQYDLDSYSPGDNEDLKKLHTAIKIAVSLNHIYSPEFKINFSLNSIWEMYQSAIAVGIISMASAAMLSQLYLYNKPDFELTRKEVSDYFFAKEYSAPLDAGVNSRQLKFIPNATPVESASIRVEMRELIDGTYSNWYYVTAAQISDLRPYLIPVPVTGDIRQFRFIGVEYPITGTLLAV